MSAPEGNKSVGVATSNDIWSSNDYPSPPSHNLTTPSGINPPSVPSGENGQNDVSVNTDLLATVANNVGSLQKTVQTATGKLQNMNPLAPGAFYDAYTLKAKVGSSSDDSNSSTSLVNSYLSVLTDLTNGLSDLQIALTQMQSKYKTFDDLSKLSVSDLDNDLNNTSDDFNNMMTDNGGNGSSPPGGGSNPPSGGSNNPPSTSGGKK
jgi:hypothetical protein